MHIFVTGATGFVGSAVVQELVRAGHKVTGLARSESAAQAVAAAGAIPRRGDLEDLESLRGGAAASDGTIHTAFSHDFSRFRENSEQDRRVIDALGSALAGSDRPLIVTSAIGVLPQGRLVTEETLPPSPSPNPRAMSEEAARALVDRGVRVSVVRLPLSVHGEGDRGGFVPILIRIARETRASVYIGPGLNRWPAVHRLEAAHVFRLACERGARGATYHAVAEEGVPFREIADVIGRRLNVPCVSKLPEAAAAHFAWFAHFAALNVPASSELTREQLGWRPTEPKLIADIDQPTYFQV